ncbi:MAG: cadherin-like beta sandwich domain-containing protein [Oscillospiraceae bacterium]|nr:cadherin-like beta sandwich domain-containing protein [Oscillospiraceae bacterium]
MNCFKRVLAFTLAAAMTLQMAPVPVFAASKDEERAILTFDDGTSSGAIVSGNGIYINLKVPGNYQEAGTEDENGLKIIDTDPTADVNRINKYIEITGQPNRKRIAIDEKFFAETDVNNINKIANLSVEGLYNALVKKGDVTEEYKVGGVNSFAGGEFTSEQQITVFTNSTIRLRAISDEVIGNGVQFDSVDEAGNSLTNWDAGRDPYDSFYGITKVVSNPRTEKDKNIKLTMYRGESIAYNITLPAQTVHIIPEEVDPDTGAIIKPESSHGRIKEGTIFTLNLDKAKSDTVLLKVYSPLAAAKVIAADALGQNAEIEKEQDFIRLKEGDTLQFIRHIFEVNYNLTYFNTQFYLKWYWLPDEQSPKANEIIKFPDAPSGYQKVTMEPLYEDVKGKLMAEVRCLSTGNPALYDGAETVTHPLVGEIRPIIQIPVIIKGTGTPASITREAEIKAETYDGLMPSIDLVKHEFEQDLQNVPTDDPNTPVNEHDEYIKEQLKVPYKISLNAYDGTIPGVAQPKEPHQYVIRLRMGAGSATSMYAVVEGDDKAKELVTMQTEIQDGSTPVQSDYQFGAQIENPSEDATSTTEGCVDLIFTPVKTGVRNEQTGKITIKFYVPDAKGKPTLALVQPATFTIGVSDSSPSSDARLQGLQIKLKSEDANVVTSSVPALWEELDIAFSPDKFEYDIELDNKYTALTVKPTKFDKFASKYIGMKAMYGTGVDRVYVPGWGPPNGGIAAIGVTETPPPEDELGYWIKADGYTPPVGSNPDKSLTEDEKLKAQKNDNLSLVESGKASPAIPNGTGTDAEGRENDELRENEVVTILARVTAEDMSQQIYRLNVMRKPKGTDATLKSLKISDPDGKVLFDGIKPNKFIYDVTIPFKVQKTKVEFVLNDPAAPVDKVKFTPALEKIGMLNKAEWLDILSGCQDSEGQRTMKLQVDTVAEDGISKATYVINITRDEPSTVNTLKELKVLDATNGDKAINYTPKFHKDMANEDYYELEIPYATDKLRISAKADDLGSTIILLAGDDPETKKVIEGIDGGDIMGANENGGPGWAKLTSATNSKAFIPAPYKEDEYGNIKEETVYQALVEVWPESLIPLEGTKRPTPDEPVLVTSGGKPVMIAGEEQYIDYETYMKQVMRYPIHIYREPASKDATLKSVKLADQDSKAIKFVDFDPEVYEYTIDVPFEVSKVKLTPTATFENVTFIKVNGRKVENGKESKLWDLDTPDSTGPVATKVTVFVVAEDNSSTGLLPIPSDENYLYTKTYVFNINRQPPSTDARLRKLESTNTVDGLKPVFAPDKETYNAVVSQGAEGVNVTATANHSGAKITIDGEPIESGKMSELIYILEVNQKVIIEVTAQDGVTKRTYSINYRNENLIEKTDNADLEDLEVTPGLMRPKKFKPSVTTYEISVDEDTFDVELFPEPADELATIKVFQDSREIGDDDDNYAAYIEDGENEFTIEVTSPDESKKKEYTVLVYRDEEDKMGDLEPLHADEMEFEELPDVIIVDLSRYPRVESEVFKELRDYPEKKIIFQGNDYSLQFNASDIDNVIPNTEIYDFKMDFESPYEDEIYDEIDSRSSNRYKDFVLCHFNYHGDLPGPALLTVSLGKKYKNDTLYWNYYNDVRERIDYYGTVATNSKGTFSVMLDHMSTYIVSEKKIAGAENKTDGWSNGVTANLDRDLSAVAVKQKLNPSTGEGGEE